MSLVWLRAVSSSTGSPRAPRRSILIQMPANQQPITKNYTRTMPNITEALALPNPSPSWATPRRL